MAGATAPYQGLKGWTIDIDPDDINFVVWDVTKDLADRATTMASVTALPTGMTISQGPTIQGTTVIALVKSLDAVATNPHVITVRIVCANGEQFDRSIYFALEDH